MESVWPNSGRHSCKFFSLFTLFTLVCLAALTATAQQSATQTNGNTPVTGNPETHSISEAAISASTGKSNEKSISEDTKTAGDNEGQVRLGAGDLVEISVYNVPELATKARVSNGGDLYLPLIDYVHVDGLTLAEAQTVIQKRLEDGGFVRNPHVTIFVDEANSQGVTVIGEVSKAGIYPDPPDRKLYQVISEAGGFTQIASRKITILRRGQEQPVQVNLPRNLGDDPSGNVDILPGDTITVPKAPIVYVVGDVGRPAGFLIDNGSLTVLQALALAGGTNRTAKMGGAKLIRKTPTGMTETKVELKKMLEAKVPDVTLQADDILFVPVSAGKLAAARSTEAALSMATAVGIYTIRP